MKNIHRMGIIILIFILVGTLTTSCFAATTDIDIIELFDDGLPIHTNNQELYHQIAEKARESGFSEDSELI